MEAFPIRILVVDDYEPWRRFVWSTVHANPKWQIIGEAADGMAAVQQARELQPDLIVLDIGLPTLNGIEATRLIREFSANCKILILSENQSRDIVDVALRMGANGYVVKSDAAKDLLPAIMAVLEDKPFLSTKLSRCEGRTDRLWNGANTPGRHEVRFHSDDRPLLDHLTEFIGIALKAGNAAIVAATESHRASLLPRLQMYGVDISLAIEQGRYLALDAGGTLSAFVRDGRLDPDQFMWAFGDLITTAIKATKVECPRVAIFGECVQLLCEQGNTEVAIQMEKLGNRLIRTHAVDILCGYSGRIGQPAMDNELFERICAEHSAVHLR